jgi:hypothetical protein
MGIYGQQVGRAWNFVFFAKDSPEFAGFCFVIFFKAALGMGIAIDFLQWTDYIIARWP